MNGTGVRWSDLWRPLVLDPRRFGLLTWLLPPMIVGAAFLAPLPTLLVAVLIVTAWGLAISETTTALLLIAFGCSVKFHYYTGLVTIFPEYLVITIAGGLWLVRWLDGDRGLGERRFAVLFAWLLFAGLISGVNAVNLTRVFTVELLLLFDAAIFFLVLRGLRDERQMARAMLWLEWTAAVVVVYGVLQFLSPFLGWDVSFSFLQKWANPNMYLGIGAPVMWQFNKTFRANAFFNDSNILAGYLAATMTLIFALCLHHVAAGRRRRAFWETLLLFGLGLLMLMTLSRSGALALACGMGVVLLFMPRILSRIGFWVFAGVASLAAAGISSLLGVNPFLFFIRLGTTFDRNDLSNRVHAGVAEYAFELFRRFPVTGAGLRNFGYHYATDVDAYLPGMMSHSVYLTYLSETGLFGTLAFLAVIGYVLWRAWCVLRDPALRAERPEWHAWTVGLFAAVVSLDVANVFYDYYPRTFVWVFSAMAVAAARLWESRARAES